MRAVRFSSIDAFAERALPFLVEREVESTMQIGLILRLQKDRSPKASAEGSSGKRPTEPFMTLVLDEEDEVAGVGLMTPPQGMTVSALKGSDGGKAAATALAAELATADDDGFATTVINGASEPAAALASAWCLGREQQWRVRTAMRVHRLDTLVPPGTDGRPPPQGSLVRCTHDDEELVRSWFYAFEVDCKLKPTKLPPITEGGPMMTNRQVWFWVADGRPRCMVGIAGHSPHGARVGPVYTPDDERGRGYGSVATAALSQKLLDPPPAGFGKDFCCLFTDLANPTSNAIYKKLGYEPVVDFSEIELSPSQK